MTTSVTVNQEPVVSLQRNGTLLPMEVLEHVSSVTTPKHQVNSRHESINHTSPVLVMETRQRHTSSIVSPNKEVPLLQTSSLLNHSPSVLKFSTQRLSLSVPTPSNVSTVQQPVSIRPPQPHLTHVRKQPSSVMQPMVVADSTHTRDQHSLMR